VRGRGARLVEADGRELIDLSGSWGAAGLGYSHPAIVEAVSRAVAEMPGASALSLINAEAIALAEELIATLPDSAGHVAYIGLSGSDANAAALRCVRAATGRQRVVSFDGSYHGGLGPGREVSGLLTADGPDAARRQFAPYPGPDDHRATIDHVRRTLADGDVAAVIVEPIMSDGGIRIPSPGFLGALGGATADAGALLICDEVKVGLGRTGMLHAFLADGARPDVVVFGKSLGGGLPLSAAVGPAGVMNAAPASSLLTTAGNPVCAAAGRAVLRTIIQDDLPAAAATLGARLGAGLAELGGRHDVVVDTRHRGLIAGIELPAADRLAAKVCLRAYQLGVVCYYVGPESNVIELTPPLVITGAEIDDALDVLDQAIGDVAAGRVSDADVAPYAGW
jgi:4-aminobutyrate aminotransferase